LLPPRSVSSCSHSTPEVPQSSPETPGTAVVSCLSVACPHMKRSEHQRTCVQPHLHMPCDIVSSEYRKCECETRSDTPRRSQFAHGISSIMRAVPANDMSSDWFSDELQDDDDASFPDRTAKGIDEGRVQFDSNQRRNGEGPGGRRDVVSGTRPRQTNSAEIDYGVSSSTGSRMPDESSQSTRKRVPANSNDRATASTSLVTDSRFERDHSASKMTERPARVRSRRGSHSDANSEEDMRQGKSVKHARRSQRSEQLQGQRATEKSIGNRRHEKPELLIPRAAASSPTQTHRDVISRVSFAFADFKFSNWSNSVSRGVLFLRRLPVFLIG
jgi:hypothetical protein